MANQDGPFEYVDGPYDGPDASELSELLRGSDIDFDQLGALLQSVPPEVRAELESLIHNEVMEFPEDRFMMGNLNMLSDAGRNLFIHFMGAIQQERLFEILEREPMFRDALLAIGQAVEQAALLFQKAIITTTPLEDGEWDRDMEPAVTQVNQAMKALEDHPYFKR